MVIPLWYKWKCIDEIYITFQKDSQVDLRMSMCQLEKKKSLRRKMQTNYFNWLIGRINKNVK